MHTPETIRFEYVFVFKDDRRIQFEINLDYKTLHLIRKDEPKTSAWAQLDNKKCANCPLRSESTLYCPIAQNLLDILPHFINTFSYEPVHVIVKDNERTYTANVSAQRGLSSLLGIIMVTSGCPVMAKLKPMVRFHLPFASVDETVFRSASTYLLGQYYRHKEGQQGDWNLEGLVKIYEEIQEVNMGMADRLRTLSAKDANINALIVLDIFAKELPQTIEESLHSLEHIFYE
jgi:hypothetical protein